MNRLLRICRIAVSLTAFAILGAGLTCSALMLPVIGPWLEHVQLLPAIAGMTLFVFVCWLMVTLVFGRIYCSTICPMGTLQDVAARAMRIGHRAREKRQYHYTPPNNTLRYGSLTLMAVCLIGGLTMITSVLDPYSAFSRICTGFFNPIYNLVTSALHGAGADTPGAATMITASVAASIVATFLFTITIVIAANSGRTLCNTVCPAGTTLGLVSRYSIFQIDIDTDKCIQCRKCEHVCKSSCIDLTDHVVDNSRCVDCFDCINVCPNDAIHYTASRKRLSQPMMQRIDNTPARSPEASLGQTDTLTGPHTAPTSDNPQTTDRQ